MPTLTVIVASTRPGRVGPVVAEWIVDRARTHTTFDVRVADLAEIGLPLLDEPEHPSERSYTRPHTRRWSATVDASDAFVLVMPEYNRGYPAPLKNALDYLSEEWRDKPVGFVGYGMSSAGLRATNALVPVVAALGMVPITDVVSIALRQRLTDDGRLDPDVAMEATAHSMLADVERLADALRPLRQPGVAIADVGRPRRSTRRFP